jgi:hypothetical protein
MVDVAPKSPPTSAKGAASDSSRSGWWSSTMSTWYRGGNEWFPTVGCVSTTASRSCSSKTICEMGETGSFSTLTKAMFSARPMMPP